MFTSWTTDGRTDGQVENIILYFICIFLLLLPTWRIKLMMIMPAASLG